MRGEPWNIEKDRGDIGLEPIILDVIKIKNTPESINLKLQMKAHNLV